MLNPPKLVDHMAKRQPGMSTQHARTGVTHHLPGLFALRRFVAMDRASGAGGFRCTIGTFLESLVGVAEKGCTLGTDGLIARMMVGAVNLDHTLHGLALTIQPAFGISHGFSLAGMSCSPFDRHQ
jgi:hypothetical protein